MKKSESMQSKRNEGQLLILEHSHFGGICSSKYGAFMHLKRRSYSKTLANKL